MSNKKKSPVKRYGNPMKNADPNLIKLFRTMRNAVELTGDLMDKLPDLYYERLRASALGLMSAHAYLAKMPQPDVNLSMSMEEFDEKTEDRRNMFLVKPFTTLEGLRVICQYCYEDIPYWQMAEHSQEEC